MPTHPRPCMFNRRYLSPGKVSSSTACNYWSNLGFVHQVPITAGWTEAVWNTKFAWHFHTWSVLGIEIQSPEPQNPVYLATCSHVYTKDNKSLLGHSTRKHGSSCSRGPSHSSPPNIGNGLSHDLSRTRIPSPHISEHGPQDCQLDQLPLTVKMSWNIKRVCYIKQQMASLKEYEALLDTNNYKMCC